MFCKAFKHTEVTKSVFVFDEFGGGENFNSTSAHSWIFETGTYKTVII